MSDKGKKEYKMSFTVRLTGELADTFKDYIDFSGITMNSYIIKLIEQDLRGYKTRLEKANEFESIRAQHEYYTTKTKKWR